MQCRERAGAMAHVHFLVERGFADAFLDRRALPAQVFGVIPEGEAPDAYHPDRFCHYSNSGTGG